MLNYFRKEHAAASAKTEFAALKNASGEGIGMEQLEGPEKIVDDFSTLTSFFS
jgi:hypothetical protein